MAQVVPTLTVGLLGGSLADAVDRRKLVLVTGSCLAAVSAAFAAQAFAGLRLVWLLYALVAVPVRAERHRPSGPAAPSCPGLLPPGQLPPGWR